MTLAHLKISPFMALDLKSVRIPISSIVLENIMLVTMYLHYEDPMKTLQNALSDKSSVASIK